MTVIKDLHPTSPSFLVRDPKRPHRGSGEDANRTGAEVTFESL